jgi:hypothetical protein
MASPSRNKKFVVTLMVDSATSHILLKYSNNPVPYTFCKAESELFTIMKIVHARRIDGKLQDNPYNVQETTDYVLKELRRGMTAIISADSARLTKHINSMEDKFPRGTFPKLQSRLRELWGSDKTIPPYILDALNRHFLVGSTSRFKSFSSKHDLIPGDMFKYNNLWHIFLEDYPVYNMDRSLDDSESYIEALQLEPTRKVEIIDSSTQRFISAIQRVLRLDP